MVRCLAIQDARASWRSRRALTTRCRPDHAQEAARQRLAGYSPWHLLRAVETRRSSCCFQLQATLSFCLFLQCADGVGQFVKLPLAAFSHVAPIIGGHSRDELLQPANVLSHIYLPSCQSWG